MTEDERRTPVHAVTVLHNSTPTLERFFAGIAAQGPAVQRLTVVDNGSSDDSLAVARREAQRLDIPVRIVEEANVGFARGYAAARAPRDDTPVLCVNPDVELAAGIVAEMHDVLAARSDIGIVTSVLVGQDGVEDTASRRRLPRFGASVAYSVLGRLTPPKLRYNARPATASEQVDDHVVTEVEATTGALMLLEPSFRQIDDEIFDTDYWMYGEDIQLCADARAAGLRTVVLESTPSVHLKGASSGRPRSLRSNLAFHRAMFLYSRKNLATGVAANLLVAAGVTGRFVISEGLGQATKRVRSLRRRVSVPQWEGVRSSLRGPA